MRYSRLQTGHRQKRKRSRTSLVVVAVVLGITAYLAGAGAAGGWLAENIINPVFNNGKSTAESTESPQITVPEISDTGQVIPSSPVSSRLEEKIIAQNISLYTLQSGAFADINNAKAAAEELSARGAAGYIAFDGSLYRTLIAGYTKESDATSVKKELTEQGIVCTVFVLESGTLEFKISAEQSQIDAVKACFDVVPDTVNTLMQIIYDADKGQNVDARILALKNNADEISATLHSVVSSDNEAVVRLCEFMEDFCKTLGDIPVSADVTAVAFSSNLKYNIISIAVKYSSFLDEITG